MQEDEAVLFAVTGLQGCPVEASDGRIGTVKDFLFDDQSWKIRWMEVDIGHWLPGRKVLIHPCAIAPLDVSHPARRGLPMLMGPDTPVVSVHLSKQKIEASPEAREDKPVTKQMEALLYEHYGWDRNWGTTYFPAGADPVLMPLSPPLSAELGAPQPVAAEPPPVGAESPPTEGDPHLRSAVSVNGYHVHASDGDLGHVENFLADDANWDIRYLVVATRDWWPGKHVQLAPYAVKDIDWAERHINVNVTREQIKSSPAWHPVAAADQSSEQRYHRHFGWPGYDGGPGPNARP